MPKFTRRNRTTRKGSVEWGDAPDVKKKVDLLIDLVGENWIKKKQVVCFRSNNSKARAYARIWGLSKVWQKALRTQPHYVIEVLAENFDNLSNDRQAEILLHELAHIPKNFSGSLLPHIRSGKRNFHDRVHELVQIYKKAK